MAQKAVASIRKSRFIVTDRIDRPIKSSQAFDSPKPHRAFPDFAHKIIAVGETRPAVIPEHDLQNTQSGHIPDLPLQLEASSNSIEENFEEFKASFPAQLEAAQTRATTLADALLTDAWKRLIGPAWKLPYALIVEMATSNALFKPGEHLFSSLQDIARLSGVSERTVQRWLSPSYKGRAWLGAWISRRTLYMTRDDGLPCRAGTVFRVSLGPKPTHDKTPVPRPRLEALKAKWRFAWDLPQAQAQTDSGLENTVLELKRHKMQGTITFPVKQEMFPIRVQIEGRDLELPTTDDFTLNSNTRHDLSSAWKRKLSASSALFADAAARADTVCERLDDRHSWAFWFMQFRRAGEADTQIWAAVGLGLEKRSRGELKEVTAAGYAVGVLRKARMVAA